MSMRKGGASCVNEEKGKIKGSMCGENRKEVLSQNFCLLPGTLSRDHKLNFDAMLSNSCRQQRKLLKKDASVEKEEAGSHASLGWGGAGNS